MVSPSVVSFMPRRSPCSNHCPCVHSCPLLCSLFFLVISPVLFVVVSSIFVVVVSSIFVIVVSSIFVASHPSSCRLSCHLSRCSSHHSCVVGPVIHCPHHLHVLPWLGWISGNPLLAVIVQLSRSTGYGLPSHRRFPLSSSTFLSSSSSSWSLPSSSSSSPPPRHVVSSLFLIASSPPLLLVASSPSSLSCHLPTPHSLLVTVNRCTHPHREPPPSFASS